MPPATELIFALKYVLRAIFIFNQIVGLASSGSYGVCLFLPAVHCRPHMIIIIIIKLLLILFNVRLHIAIYMIIIIIIILYVLAFMSATHVISQLYRQGRCKCCPMK